MKSTQIIFNGDMIRAVLDGRKTQTRRIMKIQPPDSDFQLATTLCTTGKKSDKGKHHWVKLTANGISILESDDRHFPSPYGYEGDRLWVRETIKTLLHCKGYDNGIDESGGHDFAEGVATIQYMADGEIKTFDDLDAVADEQAAKGMGKCIPSILMPRWASRITLKITGVRVERLNDISEEDAEAEGIAPNCSLNSHDNCNHEGEWVHYGRGADDFPAFSAKESFQSLWESMYGKGSWDANPWVWAIDFKVIKS